MKLWVDDIRRPPDDTWVWARTNFMAEQLMLKFGDEITEASLDHDMGLHDFDPDEEDADLRVAPDAHLQPTGNDLVIWMIDHDIIPPFITIHSWNPVGAALMASKLEQYADIAGIKTRVIVEPFDPDL